MAVPWEVQAINTCPDNFIWEANKTSLVSVAPGLYEVRKILLTLGFVWILLKETTNSADSCEQ
jgi:hypothetical protein